MRWLGPSLGALLKTAALFLLSVVFLYFIINIVSLSKHGPFFGPLDKGAFGLLLAFFGLATAAAFDRQPQGSLDRGLLIQLAIGEIVATVGIYLLTWVWNWDVAPIGGLDRTGSAALFAAIFYPIFAVTFLIGFRMQKSSKD
jgi:hypothetical protein